ncbi:hypothetical protein D3C72_2115920 [compost metagenome]
MGFTTLVQKSMTFWSDEKYTSMTPSAPKDMRGSIRAPAAVPAASMKSRRFIVISLSPFIGTDVPRDGQVRS